MENILKSLYENFNNIAGVQLVNDDFVIVPIKEKYNDLSNHNLTFYEYITFFRSLLHKADLSSYDKVFETLPKKIRTGEKLTTEFKLKDKDNNVAPYQFETINCVAGDFICLLTWKKIDRDVSLLMDSIRLLSNSYYKIIKLDINNNRYEVLKKEYVSDSSYEKFTDWCKDYSENEHVHFEDINGFRNFFKLENLKEKFTSSTSPKQEFRYRKLINGQYRWTKVEIMPSKYFSEEYNNVIIFVKDIHEDHIMQLNVERRAEFILTHDHETTFYNKISYDIKVSGFVMNKSVGVIVYKLKKFEYYKDNNVLTETLQKLEEVVKKENCYRIYSDEFIIILEDISSYTLKNKYERILEILGDNFLSACSWTNEPTKSITELVYEAENQIYEDLQ